MNIVKRMMRQIRKMAKGTKKRTSAKKQNKSHKKAMHKGGAIYGFDLNDKIGGLPANIPFNGTQDGDCPNTPTTDLGFTNYGLTRSGGGKSRKHKSKKHMNKLLKGTKGKKSNKSNKSRKHKGNFQKSKK